MTAGPVRRLRATVGDLVIVLLWAVVAAGVGVLLRTTGAAPNSPGGWDLVAFLTLVVPVAATHVVLEVRSGATPGKRWAGLAVVGGDGSHPTLRVAVLRSVVKFGPWQVAHSAAFRLAAGSDAALWLWLATGAQLVVLVSGLLVVGRRDRRSLHDLLAGTRVVALRAGGTADSGAPAVTA